MSQLLEPRNDSGAKSPVIFNISMAPDTSSSAEDSSVPSTPQPCSPTLLNCGSELNSSENLVLNSGLQVPKQLIGTVKSKSSDSILNSGLQVPRQLCSVVNIRNSIDSNSSSSSGCSSIEPDRNTCISPSRTASPASSPQSGPRFKLLSQGQVRVCRLNYPRTVISKILSWKFLRRWEWHQVVLEDTCISSKNPIGFLEEPVLYKVIQDIYAVDRWDSCGRFCIRIVIPDGSLLFQVSNCYLRDQWLHSLRWKKHILIYKIIFHTSSKSETLLNQLRNLVDTVLCTPLQDESLFKSALDIISDVLEDGQKWMNRETAEEAISIVSNLFEKTTPTSKICDFFCWHCRENPRSYVILDICTEIVHRILKHNMDFGKYPYTQAFVQDYLLAANCQNHGDFIIKSFVESMHGPGSTCPHPRVVNNLVAICLAAIHTIFENRRTLEQIDEATTLKSDYFMGFEAKLDCFVAIFVVLSSFDDWRVTLAEILQPIPFHDEALACRKFTSQFQTVIRSFIDDERCQVHQMLLSVREEKRGWIDIYCPYNIACDDEGELWSSMLSRLLSCCCRRRKFLSRLASRSLGACMLRGLRGCEPCQAALCGFLEMDVIDKGDLRLQIVSTLQSTSTGKRCFARFRDRQMHLQIVHQKGGPKKLVLPKMATDADLSRLLNSGGPFGDLECLSLAFTQITSACAEEIIKLSSLKYLSLWSTQFDDRGLRLLTDHLPNLQALNLSETKVTDGGMQELTAMRNLKTLMLNNTDLTPETFECIKKELPVLEECDIRYTDAWSYF